MSRLQGKAVAKYDIPYELRKSTGLKDSIPIRLIEKKGVFWIFDDALGINFEDKSLDDLKKKVREHLAARASLTWTPYIEVKLDHGNTGPQETKFELEYKYGEFAINPAGDHLHVEMRTPGDNRTKYREDYMSAFKSGKPPLVLPHHREYKSSWSSTETWYLPYSPEMWQRLGEIVKLIELARGRLSALLSDPGFPLLLPTYNPDIFPLLDID